jgi:hypothetical protein
MVAGKSGYLFSTDGGKTSISGFSKSKRRLDVKIKAPRRSHPMKHWTNHDLRRTARPVDSPIRSLRRRWRQVRRDDHLVFRKGRHSMSPATGGYQTFGVRLTVASHRVYGWYRPRIPWIKAAIKSAFCSIAV